MTNLAAPIRAASSLALAALLTLTLALAPVTLAQVPPSVSVTLEGTGVEVGAANTTTLAGTVTYTDNGAPAVPGGANQAGITLTVQAPEGWTITVEPPTVALAPGESADFTLTILAPALDPGAADAATEATLTASATAAAGRSAESSVPFALVALAPPALPAPPWYQTPGGIAAIAGAVLLVAGALAFVAYRRREARLAEERALEEAAAHAAYMDRETGVAIALAGGPLHYGHKREVVFRLSVTNTSARPRVAIVEVAEVTNGWRAATQVSKLPLSPGESQPVTLVVTPDAVITPGDRASVVVRAKPEEAKERDERIALDVVAPKSGVPTDPHYKIVSVQREGANNQLVRR